MGPVFGAEGGDWEVVEGVEAGRWRHGVGGGWKKIYSCVSDGRGFW